MSKQNSDIDKPEKEKKEEIENTSEKEVADKKENNNEKEEPAEETEDAIEGSEDEQAEEASREDELNRLLSELTESKEKYIRLSAEFDNYRRRTLKEKMELTKTAGEDIMLKILPVVDDFERAMVSMKEAKDCEAVLDGVTLIYNKFKDFLNLQGVKEIEAVNKEFDTDLHEALTKIPAPKKKLKGKVVDVVEKGYKLNDKVIRFSKVVVGE